MSSAGTGYSFLLLTYNQQDFVREAVLGALHQDCPPIEIVISDDCSSDRTFAVIEETVAGYDGPHRVVLNRNPHNLGLAAHIGRASEMCSGEVIVAAAGDDISLPHRARRLMALFEAESPLLVHSHARVITTDGRPAPRSYQSATFFSTTEPRAAAGAISLYLGATCAWHKDLYRKYGPIAEGAYEDLVLGFRAALEGRVGFIDEELVVYRVGQGLTNKEPGDLDAEAYRAGRIARLRVYQAVYRQRLKDALTYGLRPCDPVVRRIRQSLARAETGLAYLSGGGRALLRAGTRHPAIALRSLVSERRRQRRAIGGMPPR